MGGLTPPANKALPTVPAFFRQTLSAGLATSTATRLRAPLESASRPSAPDPAKRSKTSAESIASFVSSDAKRLSLTLSEGYNDIKNYFNVDGESRWGGAVSGDMKTFFEKTRAMDELRKQSFEETFPELYELVKDYE